MTFVLFDIDLTLVHTNGAGRMAMDGALRDWFGIESATAGIRFDGRTDRAIFAETLARLGETSPAAHRRMVDEYLSRFPAALTERGGHVLPGVPELLDRLASDGVVLGLATGNLREGARLKLVHFSLWERFLGGGFGDDYEVRARVVEAGIRALADATGRTVDPAQVVVIGDTPLDVEAAHAAGARAIAVATGRYGVEELSASGANHVFADLTATSDVVAAIRST